MNGKTMLAVALLLAATATGAAGLERDQERRAVERAVQDYVEALYEVKPDLVDRGVHRELTKRGFGRAEGGGYSESTMTFGQLRALAER